MIKNTVSVMSINVKKGHSHSAFLTLFSVRPSNRNLVLKDLVTGLNSVLVFVLEISLLIELAQCLKDDNKTALCLVACPMP